MWIIFLPDDKMSFSDRSEAIAIHCEFVYVGVTCTVPIYCAGAQVQS